jgi:putative endonuclease
MAGSSSAAAVPPPARRPDDRRALGAFGEASVARWYVARGAEVLDRNWRIRDGEIDLVVAERGAVVVVEVKTRRSTRFGTPAEAVTPTKAARLRRLAGAWLRAHPDVRARAIRIDIASVLVDAGGRAHVDVVSLDS